MECKPGIAQRYGCCWKEDEKAALYLFTLLFPESASAQLSDFGYLEATQNMPPDEKIGFGFCSSYLELEFERCVYTVHCMHIMSPPSDTFEPTIVFFLAKLGPAFSDQATIASYI